MTTRVDELPVGVHAPRPEPVTRKPDATILAALRADRAAKAAREVAREIDCNRRVVGEALARLLAASCVQRSGRGQYIALGANG